MLQLKLQEFEFIRKTAENIFFVAHRHKKTNPFGLVFLYVGYLAGGFKKANSPKNPRTIL